MQFRFLVPLIFSAALCSIGYAQTDASQDNDLKRKKPAKRPNILFAIADDWGWPHASAYGDPAIKTPTFDRIAKEGILFENAFVSSPSCTPSRNAILTGQDFWRLGWGGNLWSKLDTRHATYPNLLADAGYHVGHYRKSWGPGKLDNWDQHPAGKRYPNPDAFFESLPAETPFCFWFGAFDPHRPYKRGSGEVNGIDPAKIKLFEHFPDSPTVRSDVADYYFEVQRFDRELGALLDKLESKGLLENTIVVMTGDHGMPFPRCKANVYDSGSRVPMAVRWPTVIQPGRTITDFVNTTDLAPTFLTEAGINTPETMTGMGWGPLFRSNKQGRVNPDRNAVVVGKERHVPAQEAPVSGGTPMRAIRTDDFLLIKNFEPDRWPAGTPNWEQAFIKGCWLADCDNGPTKSFIYDHRNDNDQSRKAFELSFGKRPAFELYELANDPGQIRNVADDPKFASIREQLNARLIQHLKESGDPRIDGRGGEVFEKPKYFGMGPKHPDFKKKPRAGSDKRPTKKRKTEKSGAKNNLGKSLIN